MTVDTGAIRATFKAGGQNVIESLTRGGKIVARAGRLVGFVQDVPSLVEAGAAVLTPLVSSVETVTLEQAGPIRAVVKVAGRHAAGDRRWLPFVLRFDLYAGGDAIRVMHSFVFDGDEHRDFIRCLGLRLDVPMRDELQDSHVRFAGEAAGCSPRRCAA